MKKLLPFIAMLICSAIGFAQTGGLIINDNFTAAADGNLTLANGGWNNPSASNFVQVGSTPASVLKYTGYTSGTKYITTVNAGGSDDPYKIFLGTPTIGTANSTVYYSFVVRVGAIGNTVTATNGGGATRAIISLGFGASPTTGHFFIGNNGTNLKFGISKGATSGTTTFATANYNFATVYLVVIRYDYVTGGGTNDNMYMWVNPSLASEPSSPYAASILAAAAETDGGSATQFHITQTSNSATAFFDGFKAAYGTGGASAAVNSAFAWTQLAPVGAPLPIKVYYFNAAKGNGVNTLNWKAECSSTEATFEIERSIDGRNFTMVNSITATQARCAQPFSYDDNSSILSATTVFYRLKIIDIDGKVSYSSIVKLGGKQNDMQLVGILPNPVSNIAQLNITSVKKDNVELAIISLEGKVMYRNTVQLQPGSSNISLDVSGLAKGTYFVRGVFANGQSNAIKFVKQ